MDTPNTPIESTQPAAVAPSNITPEHPANTPIAPPHISPQQMTQGERREWKKTGKLPERVPEAPQAPPVAGSAPHHDAQTAVNAADSAPAESEKLKKRHEQLDRENHEIREKIRLKKALSEELAALNITPQAKKDDTQAQANQKAWQKYADHPNAPKESEFDDAFEYMRAVSHFMASEMLNEDRQARHQSERQSHEQSAYDGYVAEVQTQFQGYLKDNPNAVNELDQTLMSIQPFSQLADPTKARPHNILMEEILSSGKPGELLHFFSTDEGYAQWQQLVRVPPQFMGREIGKLVGQKFLASSVKTPPKPANPVTKAPAPVAQMGAKAGATVDQTKAAIAKGSFAEFMAAEDAKEGVTSRWAARRERRRG